MLQVCRLIALLLLTAPHSDFGPRGMHIHFQGSWPKGIWKPLHDIAQLEHDKDGMRIEISGSDPYLEGPPLKFGSTSPLLLRIKLRSDTGGMLQVFFYEKDATEKRSVRIPVPAGRWYEGVMVLPAAERETRLRIDPPGDHGVCVIAELSLKEQLQVGQPDWPAPTVSAVSSDLAIKSGQLTLTHSLNELGGFTLQAAGMKVFGNNRVEVIYLGKDNRPLYQRQYDDMVQRVRFSKDSEVSVRRDGERLVVRARQRDLEGGTWSLQQTFEADGVDGIGVRCELSVDQDRELLFAPLLLLHPGLKTFGETKTQALLAGVEYLEDERSSSKVDLVGPASNRRVPDDVKLTLPLMALSAGDAYVGLMWRRGPQVAALFDSPDRLWKSESHVMGLIAPGADGSRRADGELFPYVPTKLEANQPLRLTATLIGGRGKTIVPAVQQYVARSFSKDTAIPEISPASYLRATAAGWLDSPIREGATFRHALSGDAQQFGAQPASDAAWMLRWLSTRIRDASQSEQLRQLSDDTLKGVPPHQQYFSRVGHLRLPVTPLMSGEVASALPHVRNHGRNLLRQINADGVVLYRPDPAGPDLGSTHWEKHANGMTASIVHEALQAATFSGDQELLRDALAALRKLNRYDNTVPRGAQTWEVPLHTPDILAAAHLINAYRLGYQLTGDKTLLERAEYWAWTGLPFIYLEDPTAEPIGKFASIAVLGATKWEAPVWIGLPVQWCGLVYADALHGLGGEWSRIAHGIAASAIQQTYPLNHRHKGLLPDSFSLQTQTRNPSDINPGTLQPVAMRLLEPNLPAYDFAALPGAAPVMVHVPGRCDQLRRTESGEISFTAKSWIDGEYSILIHGAPPTLSLTINGRPVKATKLHEYIVETQTLVLRVSGDTAVVLKVR